MEAEKGKAEQMIAITYETLFDILRMEKRREDLQQLNKTFFEDVIRYLQQKKEILVKMEHESGIETIDEVKKLSIQYENIQKIIKDIYERREKKILLMALNTSRTKMRQGSPELLLPPEKEFYEQLLLLLDTSRIDILKRVMKGIMPKDKIKQEEIKKEETTSEEITPKIKQEEENEQKPSQIHNFMLVKFLQETEEFVGPELESYGPFSAHAVAEIPTALASVFISNGLAEEVKEI